MLFYSRNGFELWVTRARKGFWRHIISCRLRSPFNNDTVLQPTRAPSTNSSQWISFQHILAVVSFCYMIFFFLLLLIPTDGNSSRNPFDAARGTHFLAHGRLTLMKKRDFWCTAAQFYQLFFRRAIFACETYVC